MLKNSPVRIALAFCAILVPTLCSLDAAITRAAIDVGSGGLKVTIAEVDLQANKINKIFYDTEVQVPLKQDMQVSGTRRFSEQVQKLAMDTVAKLKKDLARFQPKEWSGIATAASRQSQNAQELYDRMRQELGVNIVIIPQNEEGRIGFNTAAIVSGTPREQLFSLDSGSGSFQLATELDGELQIVEGQLGYIPALALLVTEIRKQPVQASTSANPVTLDEAKQVTQMLQQRLPELSEAFADKLASPENTVVGIGNRNFIFAVAAEAIGKNTYTKEELWDAIVAHCNLKDEQLKRYSQPKEAVLSMILLHSYMEGLGIDQLTYAYANGSCEGLLLDSAYWTIEE